MNEYGFVFELSNNYENGYGIVVETNNGYKVSETSNECESAYIGNDDYFNIYASQLVYYFVDSLKGKSNTIYDTNSFEEHSISELTSSRVTINDEIKLSRYVPGETTTTKYINNYATKLEVIAQPSSGYCIPYSTAMMLKYLHNINKIELTQDMQQINSLASKLYGLMKNTDSSNSHGVSEDSAKSGIQSFGNTYSNKNLSFSSKYTANNNTSFSETTAEIDSNYPVILMFKVGAMYSLEHATTMYGYKVVTTENTYGIVSVENYVIVKDPGTTGVPTKTVAWSTSNIYGYFIIYVG